MRARKLVWTLTAGTLMAINAIAAEAPEQPLHVLYLGAINSGVRGGGFGSRTNYVYLPGQTLAPVDAFTAYMAPLAAPGAGAPM